MTETDNRDRTNLRLNPDALAKIDIACSQRPGKVSRNTWINEAIQEKLTRDSNDRDKQNEKKYVNG